MAAALLACDWGTTNLRAWTLDGAGAVVEAREFALGVARLAPGEAAQRFQQQVRPALMAEALPAVLCGMIGSNLGWRPAPYLDCPASLPEVARALTVIDSVSPTVSIAPGLRCRTPWGSADVLRGEETQIFGWITADSARAQGRRLVCHPGTHAKWALIEDGRLVRFQTAMTGELFAVLREHSVLRGDDPAGDEAAFDKGVHAAGDGHALAARLFSARARVVGDGAPAGSTSSYLSGLLIGAEVAALPGLFDADDLAIDLLGDPKLCAWYARALAARGMACAVHDGEAAAVAGLFALYSMETRHAAG